MTSAASQTKALLQQVEVALLTPHELRAALAGFLDSNAELKGVFFAFRRKDGSVGQFGLRGEGEADAKTTEPLTDSAFDSFTTEVWLSSGAKAIPGKSNEWLREGQKLFAAHFKDGFRSPLSGLPDLKRNSHLKRTIVEFLFKYVRPDDRGTVLFIDLDGFKALNEMHGYAAGDRAISLLGRFLHEIADRRYPHAIPLHNGGDEFVLLLATGGAKAATECALDLLREVASLDWGVSASLGLSIGGSMLNGDLTKAIEVAEGAVKGVKKAGKGTFRFAEDYQSDSTGSHSFDSVIPLIRGTLCDESCNVFRSPWLDIVSDRVYRAARADGPGSLGERISSAVSEIIDLGKLELKTAGVRLSAPASCGQILTPDMSHIDLGVAIAHGVHRALLRSTTNREEKVTIGKDAAGAVSVNVGSEVLATTASLSGPASEVIDTGHTWTANDAADVESCAPVLLVQIGHKDVGVPLEYLAARIIVDDRPTAGGGLPDFWAVTLARLIVALQRSPNVIRVLVIGEAKFARKTIQLLESPANWNLDDVASKTNLSRFQVERARELITGKVVVAEEWTPELLANLALDCLPSRHLVASRADSARPSRPFLERDLRAGGVALSILDGCRVRTIAEAYPTVLEILRTGVDQAELIVDQAGMSIRELVDFRVELTHPGVETIPRFFLSEENELAEYAHREFSPTGLFGAPLEANSQRELVIEHVRNAIRLKHPFATRRAILVVPHDPEANGLRPLGLVSIRCLPRIFHDRAVLSFSFTWRTVEALVGFPYSIFGSVRFAEKFVDDLRARQQRDERPVELGRLSYIAHSLHMFMDEQSLSIARRIVNDASA